MSVKPGWGAIGSWTLGFGLVSYLGLEGGGYDPLVHDQVGIAVWWVLLATVLVGALPNRRPGRLALVTLGLLAALAIWTALSLSWTESVEQTWAEVARIAGYLGVFALALAARGAGHAKQVIAGIATAIVAIAAVALLSRLHPAWFPAADNVANFLDARERLAYPLNYWNALAALIAMGAPLLLAVATSARSVLARAAAAAALPALALTIFLTLSRGGIAAGAFALAVFLVFTSDRLPKLLMLLLAGAGGAILIGAATQRDALQNGLLSATARQQGDEMLAITLLVCLAVGSIQACVLLALRGRGRPAWTSIPRRYSLTAASAALLVLLIVAATFDAPGRASGAWGDFKRSDPVGHGTERLGSVAGQNRYQLWSAAAKQNATRPLSGTGAGTFQYWWMRSGDTGDTVLDTHSLYMQTLGELGIVGLILLAAFLLAILIGGARNVLRADPPTQPLLAAALAACAAFCLSAAFEWHWQIPVLPVVLLLLGAALIGGGQSSEAFRLKLLLRIVASMVAITAITAIAIPLASTTLVRESEEDAREGDLAGALEAARSARNAQPSAASPRLQQALVLEELGALSPAASAASAATEREETNWRNWLVLSRVEAQRGQAAASIRAYRRARALNPYSSFFKR